MGGAGAPDRLRGRERAGGAPPLFLCHSPLAAVTVAARGAARAGRRSQVRGSGPLGSGPAAGPYGLLLCSPLGETIPPPSRAAWLPPSPQGPAPPSFPSGIPPLPPFPSGSGPSGSGCALPEGPPPHLRGQPPSLPQSLFSPSTSRGRRAAPRTQASHHFTYPPSSAPSIV